MSASIKNICLLAPGFGTTNLGLSALTAGTVASALASFPKARLSFLDYDDYPNQCEVAALNRRVLVPMVNMRFSKKVWLRNNIALLLALALAGRAFPIGRFKRSLCAKNACLREIEGADLVLSLAGGDSFSDIYGLARLWYVSLPQLLALAAKRPLVLLPQTIGPFKTALGRRLARLILRNAHRIYTRDAESLEEVARLLGHKPQNAALAYDMGIALDPLPPPRKIQDQIRGLRGQGELVGLNVSGLLYAGGYTGRNQFELRSDYREMVEKLIEFFVRQPGVQVLLVPHVLGAGDRGESDTTACAQLARSLKTNCDGRLHTLPGTLDHHQVKWAIGQCDFFLGSRMHACIAALSQGVPALGLAYSRKFAGVFRTMDAEDLVVDLTQQDLAGILHFVAHRFQQRLALTQRLRAAAPGIRNSVLELFQNTAPSEANASDRASFSHSLDQFARNQNALKVS